jgi:hypothetical protein
VAEAALFRSAWEQAAAAGLAEGTSGLAAMLTPRAHPGLTKDPLGLVVSATAAGLGLVYLFLATTGVSRRVRFAIPVLAAALVILAPVLFLASVGTRTGVVRAQDRAVVQAAADAACLARLESPYGAPPQTTPRGREAYSASFRLDPPAELLPTAPLVPPGPAVLAALARPLGGRDPRLVALVALGLVAGVLALRVAGRRRRAAVGLVLLAAPLSLGTVLGSPFAHVLLALVGAWAARERGAQSLAGFLCGVAVALDHRAVLVAPFLLAAGLSRAGLGRRIAAVVAGYALLALPVALMDPRAFLERLGSPSVPGPGLGSVNLLAYWGAESLAAPLQPLAAIVAVAAIVWLLGRRWAPLAGAGVASLVGSVLAPALSADAVAVPMVLLALAAIASGEGTTETTTETTTHNGQRTTDNGQRTTDNGQRTTDNGQRTTDNGQRKRANG